MCNSPEPARMISPVSYSSHLSNGSDLANLVNPFCSLGRSAGFLLRTATRNTGDTEYFIYLIGYVSG